MKKYLFSILFANIIVSCSVFNSERLSFTTVKIDNLLSEAISSRALTIEENKVWYAGNNGKYGYVTLDGTPSFSEVLKKEELKLEFRSIAQTSDAVFILTVANPALLYKIDKKTKEVSLVYQEVNEKVFYDSMQFLNDKEGFAIGDPTENCPSFIKTVDGGQTWQKVSCDNLPKFESGEAFFAASNTNLIVKQKRMFMVSGGKKSRVLVSEDKGQSWKVYDTPLVQGEAMTGAFCADFYNENVGIIAGGNYQKPEQNFQNKAITKDGGKTWQLVSENEGFGYVSCVQFVPGTQGKSIVEVGANGLFYSNNLGKNWKQLLPDKDFLTLRFIDGKAAVATGKNRIVKLTFE
ncbi:WD40/YVTN/BNR-like repeat-containing protein [Flavobacterium luminosum]|uniref:Oxidoreductase n=1 Tax=Flavobacterium luminosum TaxID=2949086 RepID=A0ABT0TMI6_9FLAO|nr:oxidoreductase [Flavobacterium sp. HXWNR70]MCL9808699.1 oxidoreductase [Flavobacterium sp. HXWNR70]